MHINAKGKAFKKYKTEGSLAAFKHYKECNKKCKDEIRAAKKENERHIAEESKKNPKKFFKYINSKKARPEHIGPIKDDKGVLATEDRELY